MCSEIRKALSKRWFWHLWAVWLQVSKHLSFLTCTTSTRYSCHVIIKLRGSSEVSAQWVSVNVSFLSPVKNPSSYKALRMQSGLHLTPPRCPLHLFSQTDRRLFSLMRHTLTSGWPPFPFLLPVRSTLFLQVWMCLPSHFSQASANQTAFSEPPISTWTSSLSTPFTRIYFSS